MDLMALGVKALRCSSVIISAVWEGFATMATDNKCPRLLKRIGTHDGVFHCDEALACFMLQRLPDYQESEIVRTRNADELSKCDIVIDVGGVYNPEIHRYDHHQRGFDHTLATVRPDLIKNQTIRLSSGGLIYAHFGLEVLSEIFKENDYFVSTEGLLQLYRYIYEEFLKEIDAIDNGIPLCADDKKMYKISTHLSARVNRLNPKWNDLESPNTNKLFEKAVDMVGKEFTEVAIEAVSIWWPAREIVKRAIENRKKVHESGEIIMLEKFCPWIDHFFVLENELRLKGEIKFCIFKDNTTNWRVRAVPVQPGSFICRVFLHKDWRGMRDLSEIAGIPDCIFCHHTGFIGGNKTREGALKMALKSLQASGAYTD